MFFVIGVRANRIESNWERFTILNNSPIPILSGLIYEGSVLCYWIQCFYTRNIYIHLLFIPNLERLKGEMEKGYICHRPIRLYTCTYMYCKFLLFMSSLWRRLWMWLAHIYKIGILKGDMLAWLKSIRALEAKAKALFCLVRGCTAVNECQALNLDRRQAIVRKDRYEWKSRLMNYY